MLNPAEHEIFPAHKFKMPTIDGIKAFISKENIDLGLSEAKKLNSLMFLYLQTFKISCSLELSMIFYNLGTWVCLFIYLLKMLSS